MKIIQSQGVITTISSKQDGSLGLRVATPELSTDEKALFMEIQGLNLDITFKPLDFETKEIAEVKSEVDRKTPSQRLRSVLYLYWEQEGRAGDFNDYYNRNMNKIIESIKAKLE